MYFLYLDTKCDDMATDFHHYSGLSIGVYTLTRNYWCGDKNYRNKKILFACAWDTRDPKNIFSIQPHERGLSGRAEGNIEKGLQLQSSFSAECSGGEKRPENTGGTKITITVNINCNTETCWDSRLGVSIQVHVGGLGGGGIQAAPLPHRSETISVVFSSATQQPAFSPFYSDTQSTCIHFKPAWTWWFITVILTSGFIVIKVSGGSSRGRLTGTLRSVDTDARERKIQKKRACWWIVRPNQVKIFYPRGSICFSVFSLTFQTN